MKTSIGALALVVLLVAAASASAAPSSRMYYASFSGTQHSSWTFEETGTCTGDDFVEHPFKGQGSGTSVLSFRTPKRMRIVVSRVGRTKRWAFSYQATPSLPSQKRQSILVDGERAGVHSQQCPNSESQTFSSPTDDCGERTYRLTLKAKMNLAPLRPGGFMLEAIDNVPQPGAGRPWTDCPYFWQLNPTEAHPNDDMPYHIPGGGLMTIRKKVGSGALRRGKAVTFSGKRIQPYDQSESTGDTTQRTRGRTVLEWKLQLTPVKKGRKRKS